MAKGPEHERYAAWLKRLRRQRAPKIDADLLAMADAYDAAVQSGNLSASQLQRVVEGASSPRAMLWYNATDLLMKLSGRWPAAADAIATMFRSRKATVRFAALCSLGRGTPIDITDALLGAGLRDKSSRVRWKAAARANDLDRRKLIPDITAALVAESDEKARRSIELSRRMLRDDHWVRPDSPGSVSVTARLHDGGIANKIVSNDELRTRGIESILAELRASAIHAQLVAT